MGAETRHLHLWSGIVILGVYLAGAATAAGVSALMEPRRFPGASQSPQRGPLAILRELGLDDAQRSQAMRIITTNRGAVEAAVGEAQPKIRAARERTFDELRAILTPEQAQRFDALRAAQVPAKENR